MRKMLRSSISSLTAVAFAFGSLPVRANPLGGQVVAGSASITGTGTSQVTVNQSSVKAIIDWRSFNIANGETTTFVQPNSGSVTLNRVTGGLGLSTINGMINANGGVYVVNPDGILFGRNAQVNVGSFLGTTHDITNSDFMAGKYNFTISGNAAASIVNQGTITAATSGFAALVAPGVRNEGIINARLGTVALASGNAFTLDLYGDNLIKLQPGDAIAGDVKDAATGQTMTSLVQNTGTLKANGGTVSMTAVTARKVLDSVINSSGTVEADSVGTQNGMVVFGAQTATTKLPGAPIQNVKVSGTVKAVGRKPNTTGGKIQVTGENIQLASAKLDASGQVGGGKILIGGDWKGGDPTAPAVTLFGQSFETQSVPTATQVTVDANSVLNASAIKTGNGGKVVVWADGNTTFAGSLLAYGGIIAGNGGFAEVSGKNTVNFAGIRAELSAPRGTAGTILFDPTIENIDQNAGDALANALNVQANVAVAADTINVLPSVNILKTAGGDATLALFATQGINIGANVTIGSSAGKLSLYLDGDSTNGYLFLSPDGNVQSYTVLQTASLPTAMLGITAAIAYPNGVPVISSSQSLAQYANSLSIPNLNGADVYTVAQTYASTAAGLGITQMMSALAGLSKSSPRISIDSSARFYLNGGSYLAYGNDYQIVGVPNSYLNTYAGTNAQDATNLAFANVAALYGGTSLANLAAKLGLAAGAGPYAGLTYTSPLGDTTAAALSYNVNRVTVYAPDGVLSSGPIPGVTLIVGNQFIQVPFSSIVANLQSQGVSSPALLNPWIGFSGDFGTPTSTSDLEADVKRAVFLEGAKTALERAADNIAPDAIASVKFGSGALAGIDYLTPLYKNSQQVISGNPVAISMTSAQMLWSLTSIRASALAMAAIPNVYAKVFAVIIIAATTAAINSNLQTKLDDYEKMQGL